MYPVQQPKSFHFDVDSILAPISPDAPTGESLRYEGTYDSIKTARTEDDPVLERGVWKVPLKRADWADVARLCEEALRTRSKDLQVGAWLVEAWLHLYGFTGLREGLRMLAGLCNRYWPDVHPQVENGDVEYRTGPFIWINDKLPIVIKLMPLTSPQSDDVQAYCWADWELACRSTQTEKPTKQQPSQAIFQQSAMLTSTDYYTDLLSDVESAMDSLSELDAILEAALESDAPSLRQLWSTIEPIREFIVSILSQREKPVDHSQAEEMSHATVQDPTEGSMSTDLPIMGGPIRSRADAYRRLAEAADYLARTEPHSPTPYLVRRAIAWGGMQLNDLLVELVRDNSQLAEIFRLLQIGTPPK